MKHAFLALVLLATALIVCKPCFGQDALAGNMIKGLKNLRSVAVIVRPNTPREIASLKEWGDMVEVGLRRNVPDLGRLDDAQKAGAWLELSVITTDAGGFLELSLYRWVKVVDTGEEIFSKVWWDSRVVFGGISKRSLQDALDALLTSFAADYSRARRYSK